MMSLIIDGASVGGVLLTGDTAGNDITLPDTAITDEYAGRQLLYTEGTLLFLDNHRVLNFPSSGSLTLKGLTITGGNFSQSASGGGISSRSR